MIENYQFKKGKAYGEKSNFKDYGNGPLSVRYREHIMRFINSWEHIRQTERKRRRLFRSMGSSCTGSSGSWRF